MKIFLDLDGVLVDFVGGSLAYHGKTIPPREVRWDFPQQVGFAGTWVGEFWDPLGRLFWSSLPWTAEGQDLLSGLEGIVGQSRIVLATSPCKTEGGVEGKIDWIRTHLPAYARRFNVCPCKAEFAAPDKLLLDDHGDNVHSWVTGGDPDVRVPRPWNHRGPAILVPRPWNHRRDETDDQGRFDVAKVLDEVRNLVG
jgi:hypothetical protein